MIARKRYRNRTKGSGRLFLGIGLVAALLVFAPGAWAGTLQINGSTGSVSVPEGGTANVSWDFSENAPATGVYLRINQGPMGPCSDPLPYSDYANPDSGYSAGTIGGKALTLSNPSYHPDTAYYVKVCAWQLGGNPDNLGPESNTVALNYGKGLVFSPNLDTLCKILDCDKPKLSPGKAKEMGGMLTQKDPYEGIQDILQKIVPFIENAMGFPGWGTISPGATLAIKGRNFQPKQNEQIQVMLHGSFPGGVLQLGGIEILSDTAITAVVPATIVGVLDHTVQIQVKKGTILGNKFDFAFRALRETRILRMVDPAVKVVHCGNDANTNRCNDPSSMGNAEGPFAWTIYGIHANAWAAVGDDEGTDRYRITLKNGWVFKDFRKKVWFGSSDDERIWGPSPAFPYMEADWEFKVKWRVSPADRIHYGFDVTVEGPVGTLPW